jgi:hypothetical protein
MAWPRETGPQPGVTDHEEGKLPGDGEGTNMPAVRGAPGGARNADVQGVAGGDDLSPEEQAVSGIALDPMPKAAGAAIGRRRSGVLLAEGRDQPPKDHRDEPVIPES